LRKDLTRTAIGIAALAIAYFLVAELGLELATVTRSVTLVWPATGLALVALHRGGLRLWPGVWLGAFVANALTPGVPLLVALAIASGNTLEAVAGTHLLRRIGFDDRFERSSDVVRFTLGACVASTLVSATIGSMALWFSGAVHADHVLGALRTWWLGDLTGDLVFAPVLFTCVRPVVRPTARQLVEGLAALACLIAMTMAVFGLVPITTFARAYMLFPMLLWPALRFGPRGASFAIASMSAIAVWATARQHGPFTGATLGESLLSLQTFTCLAALTPLFLAATVAERDRAKRAVEDFIAVASHELKTPLTPLLLNLQRIERVVSPHADIPALAPVLASSERQIIRLSRLVDDLLDMTRARVGKLTLDRAPLDLSSLVRETTETFRDQLGREKCELELGIDGPVEGRFDGPRMQQVVANLVTNAMKFGRGKPITVSLKRADRSGRATAVLEVRDRGMGIAAEQQALIFDRFGRAASTSHISGLGLGLYIVRQIVEAHDGHIAVDSKEGAGSTFVVELPLA
jgi:signal transduction histidine kinase